MTAQVRIESGGSMAIRQKIVFVLGMHRSGTSCLAGMLEEAGLFLGEVVTQARYNPKGNRENLRIRALNDEVLSDSRGAWDKPPDRVVWQAGHRRKRDELFRDFQHVQIWGFKDPRTLLPMEGWLESLEKPAFAGTFRHPVAVAQSLCSRQKGSAAQWMDLWRIYNGILLDLHDKYLFPVVDFDWTTEVYKEGVNKVITTLGIKPQYPTRAGIGAIDEDSAPHSQSASGNGFFDPSLRHWSRDIQAELPKEIRSTYLALRERAG
jgi:hypothetical protein